MSVTYRRSLQALFAVHLADGDIADVQRVLDLLVGTGQEIDDASRSD